MSAIDDLELDPSRAATLRDAIAQQLTQHVGDVPVDVVVFPDYDREEVSAPRIAVISQTREIEAEQGNDTRNVIVGIGVVGASAELEGFAGDKAARRRQHLARADQYDALFEYLLALWSPGFDAPLRHLTLAEHRFQEIDQPASIDFAQYRERGIWVSVFTVSYFDERDQ